MSKGSAWNIWDLHLHTPCSALNNQFGDYTDEKVWDNYITNVENKAKEKEVAAIAFTDYFTIDGYKRVLDYKKAGRLQNILVMPNIEFRIDKIINRGKDGGDPKRLNFHVVFSPDVQPNEIEEGFLQDLDFYYENDPFDPAKTRKLKPFNLIEFGKLIKEQQASFTGSDFEVGCKTAVVQSEQIKKTLENRFYGRYLLGLAEENLSLIDWGGQDHAVKKQLIQMSHIVFSSNQGSREFYLGKKHNSPKEYLQEFRSLKPCVWGCDSHSLKERFLEPDDKRFTWIKGEVTWEGLKQILYEPSDRVCIQEKSPEHQKSIFTLAKLEIEDSQVNQSLHVKRFESELNPNLVTIIGGRGSGKTALLDLIASLFREGEKLSELKNSFYYRLFCDEESVVKANIPVGVAVEFNSGERYSKKVGEDDKWFEKSDILYLTQNHFDEYSSNPSKLNSYIIELVFERFPVEKRKYREMQDEISELEQKIQTINLEIDQLTDEIDGRFENESTNLNIKKGEKEDFSQRLSSIEEKQGVKNDEILNLTKRQDELKANKRDMESLLYQLSIFSSFIEEFYSGYINRAKEINLNLIGLLEGASASRFAEVLPDLQNVLMIITANENGLQPLLSNTEDEINKNEVKLGALEGLSLELATLQTKINETSIEIDDIQNLINLLMIKQEQITALAEERFTVYSLIMKKIIYLRVFLQETIEKFEAGKNEMLDHLEFSASVDITKSFEFLESLLEKVDNRINSPSQVSTEYLAIAKEVSVLLNGTDEEVVFSTVIGKIKGFGTGLKRRKSVSLSDLYNSLLQRYFDIGLRIKFSGKDLSELSMGERAVVLLKVLLALDDTPLLIDQPEEHLDNRYIYNELVPAIRKAKTKRQIIIATHNANLVVNTDAEQILIAKYDAGTLSCEVGTLENASIRDQIKTILEGGDEAFKKREEKYGYIF